jgi:hypothetical protein
MFTIPRRHIIEGLVLIAFSGLVVLGVAYENARDRAAFYGTVRSEFGDIRDRLHELAELTARNDADDTVSRAAVDCGERAQYEEALDRLNDAHTADLNGLAVLHASCGDFFALRKRLMVHQMELATSELERYAALLEAESAESQELIGAWKDIIGGEGKRRDLLDEQVALQGRIIDALRRGDRAATAPLALRAKELAEELAVTHQEIENLRAAESLLWQRYIGT